MSDSGPTFMDSDDARYTAKLSPGGVRFISQALQARAEGDQFTVEWVEFEQRCKDDHWEAQT